MTNAVLLRNLPLTVRDVSSSGCLIESSAPLQVGTVGWLEVEFEGERRFEWFRIARVHARGEHAFLAGVEFLPLAAASADSFSQRHWPVAANGAGAGKHGDGWTIVCAISGTVHREVGEAPAESAYDDANRDSSAKIRGFLSTT